MKRFILIAIVAIAAWTSVAAQARVPMGETLRYKVLYKWGLVHKQAGRVAMSTTDDGNGMFKSQLVGSTEKWADKFFSVRDTLLGTMSKTSFEPSYYEKISHEGGDYKRDVITYKRSGDRVTADCQRFIRKKKSPETTQSEKTFEAEGLTLDMLSAFYYMRMIDYPALSPGDQITLNVFSGKRKELLTITYVGQEDIKVDKNEYSTYRIKFKFTGEQGKKTSDDIEAWISTDADRAPIKVEGKLAVGKIQCIIM